MIKSMNEQKKDNELFGASGIYLIHVNGVIRYVGSSLDYMKRKSNHLANLRHNKHGNSFLQDLFNEFGEENFVFSVIPETTLRDPKDLYILEAYYLEKYQPQLVNIQAVKLKEKPIRNEAEKKENAERLSGYFSGENNPSCKITREQAMEIINLKKEKIMRQVDIAALYGISVGQVSKIGRTSWLELI